MIIAAAGISSLISRVKRYKMAFVFGIVLLSFASFGSNFGFVQNALGTEGTEPEAATTTEPATSSTSASPVQSPVTDGNTEWAVGMILSLLTIIYSAIAWAIGKLITIVIGLIIIPILGYNNFADSNLIDIGWPLVRDVVNMFIILLLIIIAMKTMLGLKTGVQEAQQQILRVFFAVIAVNFSRTICVFFIDLGQVIMFTFVNAIKDIAAGNFVQLFQLNSVLSVDSGSIYENSGNGVNAFGFLGSAYAVVVLLAVVLAVLVILAVVFLYRIVILWILVILSPLAFFLWGAKDVLPQAAGRQKDWWNKFTGAVMLGPMMAFFLWLGLAAASSGSIASAERFESPGSSDAGEFGSGLYNEVFQVDRLLSLMIGVIIIAAGFQASSSAASGLGGIAGRLITEKGGMGLIKTAAAAPARYTYRAGRATVAGGIGLAKEGYRQAEGRGIIDNKARSARWAAQAGEWQSSGSMIGAVAGRGLASVAGKLERTASSVSSEGRKQAATAVAGMSGNEKFAYQMAWAGEGDPSGLRLSNQNVSDKVAMELLQDKKAQKRFVKNLKETRGMSDVDANVALDTVKARALKAMDGRFDDFAGDDKDFARKKNTFQTQNLHLIASNMKEDGKSEKEIVDAIEEIVSDGDFRLSNLSREAYSDPLVREAFGRIPYWVDKGGTTYLDEQIEAGRGVDPELRRALQGQSQEARNASFESSDMFDTAAGFLHGKLDIANLTPEAVDTNNRFSRNADNILEGISRAVARGYGVGTANRDVAEALVSAYDKKIATTQSAAKKREYQMAKATVTGSGESIGIKNTGEIDASQTSAIELRQMVQDQAILVASLTDAIGAGNKADATESNKQVARVVATSVDKKDIDSLGKQLQNANSVGNSALVDQIRTAFDNIRTAMAVETAALRADNKKTTRYDQLTVSIDAMQRALPGASTPPSPSSSSTTPPASGSGSSSGLPGAGPTSSGGGDIRRTL